MPGRSVEKFVVTATGKVAGKGTMWLVAVFPGVAQAKPYVALLRLAHAAKDHDTIKTLDPHAPYGENGDVPTDVKYTGRTIQYSPQTADLSDDTTLG